MPQAEIAPGSRGLTSALGPLVVFLGTAAAWALHFRRRTTPRDPMGLAHAATASRCCPPPFACPRAPAPPVRCVAAQPRPGPLPPPPTTAGWLCARHRGSLTRTMSLRWTRWSWTRTGKWRPRPPVTMLLSGATAGVPLGAGRGVWERGRKSRAKSYTPPPPRAGLG